MHTYLIAVAGHATHGHLSAQVGPVIAAMVVATVVVGVFKGIGRLLSRKPKNGARQASPYATTAKRR